MRILLVNKNWFRHGGLEAHMFAVRDVFEELGHEVVPFAMADPASEPAPTSEHFVTPVDFRSGGAADRARAVGRAVFGVQTVRRLRDLLDEHPVDAVHVLHAYHQLGTSFLRLLDARDIPTVLSVHDYKLGCPSYRLFDDRTASICTRCFDSPLGYLWAPVGVRCWDGSAAGGAMLTLEAISSRVTGAYRRGPDAVMTVNELQTVGVRRMGVPAERIFVVPHFADIDVSAPLAHGEGHVLYVGRLVSEKGVDVLIRACARAGLPLRVVGVGRDLPDLEALAASLGVDVTFLGKLAPDDVLAEMGRASVLSVPSVWHEVWGLVVNEAWQAGLPVVGSEVGGLADLLRDGRGLLVPPGDVAALADALRSVVDDPERGRSLVTEARQWAARELTRDGFVERLKTVYRSAGVEL